MTTKRVGKQIVDEESGEILATEVTVAPIFWKTPFNHNTDTESARTAHYSDEPSLTQQQFKDDADINVILKRFQQNKEVPPMVLPEHFTDLTGRTTYFDMASKVAKANETFYLLPADKRAEHLNDPNRWADAVVKATAAGDLDAMRDLGLDVPSKEAVIQEHREKELAKAAKEADELAKRSGTPSGSTPAPEPQKGAPAGPK